MGKSAVGDDRGRCHRPDDVEVIQSVRGRNLGSVRDKGDGSSRRGSTGVTAEDTEEVRE